MADEKKADTQAQTDITIYYPKGSHHVTVHADGAWAGLTGQLEVQLAFYTELQPMPSVVRHRIVKGNLGPTLGPIIAQNIQAGLIRETEATIIINPMVAINLIRLLESMLAQLKPHIPEPMRKYVEEHEAEALKTPVTPLRNT